MSWFGANTMTALRRQVHAVSADHGLSGGDLHRFVLATHEAITNAVLHGGGRGQLVLWCTEDRLCCEISDHGPGLPAHPVQHRGHFGLTLIHRACTSLDITTDVTGTRVRLSQRLAS